MCRHTNTYVSMCVIYTAGRQYKKPAMVMPLDWGRDWWDGVNSLSTLEALPFTVYEHIPFSCKFFTKEEERKHWC